MGPKAACCAIIGNVMVWVNSSIATVTRHGSCLVGMVVSSNSVIRYIYEVVMHECPLCLWTTAPIIKIDLHRASVNSMAVTSLSMGNEFVGY